MSTVACTRCLAEMPADARYGPCAPCRAQLREIADRRYAGWLAVHFLAGQLTAPKPAVARQDRPGAPAGESARAVEPAAPAGAFETPFEERASTKGSSS